MSSDKMKPRPGNWAVTIDFLKETTITFLSNGSDVKCELCSSFHCKSHVVFIPFMFHPPFLYLLPDIYYKLSLV
uniref:Uncharacterized protein n=1 Tax=Timema tahoe TaxID=61484 RepID=A0A7R9IGY0_9NEOP|nr:unnamed protein product [Timema tahoe]